MILKTSYKHIFRIIELLIILKFSRAIVSSKDDQLGYRCQPSESGYFGENSEFQRNLNDSLLLNLVPNASNRSSSSITMGEGSDQVNALYYCRGDVSLDECHNCVTSASTTLLNLCKMLKQGIIYYDQCTLGYSNRSIFNSTQEYLALSYPNYNYTNPDLGDYLNQYQTIFKNTMKNLINQAANNASLRPQGFATGLVNLSTSQSLRGVVQCAPIINGTSCQQCLTEALALMQGWTNTAEFFPSCFVGFELYGSRPSAPPISSSSGHQVGHTILLVVVLIFVAPLLIGGFWCYLKSRSRKDDSVTEENGERKENWKQNILSQFTYLEIKEITNGFTKMLGEGGYAKVYYGWLQDNNLEVAVKVFSKTDAPKQFSTEIEVLGRISHKNLVSLIGYCEEGDNLALIYEFMDGGDLKYCLLEHSDSLSWKKRVEIAIDTAQGLDYLHNGCSPPIIHRDVKPANILLNKELRAKVADFGVSKIFPTESVSNLLTSVVGTPGYVDPRYSLTGQLNEKGDVYSFGVVLLELITGRRAILNNTTNLVQWVESMLATGDIASILDSKLSQDVDDNYVTVWKAVELAVRCAQPEPTARPKMAQIVMELKECLSMMSALSSSSATNSTEGMSSAALSSTLMSPSPC